MLFGISVFSVYIELTALIGAAGAVHVDPELWVFDTTTPLWHSRFNH
jgi:hypothetical protein